MNPAILEREQILKRHLLAEKTVFSKFERLSGYKLYDIAISPEEVYARLARINIDKTFWDKISVATNAPGESEEALHLLAEMMYYEILVHKALGISAPTDWNLLAIERVQRWGMKEKVSRFWEKVALRKLPINAAVRSLSRIGVQDAELPRFFEANLDKEVTLKIS